MHSDHLRSLFNKRGAELYVKYEQVPAVYIRIYRQHLWLALNSILISVRSHWPLISLSELIRANHIESPKCSGVEFQSGFMVK